MSALETIDDVFYLIKKYILPTVFLIAGIWLLYLALTPAFVDVQDPVTKEIRPVEINQVPMFMYAALIMIMVSVIWFLYLLEIIKSTVGYAIMAIMLIGSVAVLYIDYMTVKEEVDFNNKYAERDLEIKTRIMDIKAAEIAYKEVNGSYTDSFDDLIDFVKNGKKPDFVQIGSLPERTITPEERDMIYGDNRPIDNFINDYEGTVIARNNGGMLDGKKFSRDTNFVSVMEAIFTSDRYLESRGKIGGLLPFHPDSMQYVPFSGQLATLDTASLFKGEIRVPTLLISMTHPMEDPIDGFVPYTIGSVDDNHLRDNWSK